MPPKHLTIDDCLDEDPRRSGGKTNETRRGGGQLSKARRDGGLFNERQGDGGRLGETRRDLNLFEDARNDLELADGAVLLAGFACAAAAPLLAEIAAIAAAAPFRNMVTRGGHCMSVAMTNCGTAGWVSDRSGYRYDRVDPQTGAPWPSMPTAFTDLAFRAAMRLGFANFAPDVCLINRYGPGARMALHQDRDERSFDAPIVSVSFGLPATFLFGGATRSDRARRVEVLHGDVVVWGGPARMRFHGVMPLADGRHPATGRMRLNLTFRRAL